MVLRAGLVATVGYAQVRARTADHRRQDGERLLEGQVELGVRGVHEHVRPGLYLRDARSPARDVVGARAAGGHDIARQPRLTDRRRAGQEALHRPPRGALALSAVLQPHGGAFVAGEPSQLDSGVIRGPARQRHRRVARCDAAAEADVDLDQHTDGCAGVLRRLSNLIEPETRVYADLDVGAALRERGHPRALIAADHLVRDQNIVAEPGCYFRLGDRRAGQPDARARRQLTPRDLRCLVSLEVRPQLAWPLGEELGHALDVPLHGGDVDD